MLEIIKCLIVSLLLYLSRDIKKSKRNDLAIDILNEQKDLLNEAKEIKTKKLTR